MTEFRERVDTGYTVESVELDGMRLEYVEQGDPSGVPVVLLHGVTDSWRSFEPVTPRLPEAIHAYAVSQRGHGDSDRPASGYGPRDFAADLASFMDAVGLESAVIVGHSLGSYAAQRFAIDYPERTLGLVLMGSFTNWRDNEVVKGFWEDALSTLEGPIDPDFMREFQESPLMSQAFLDTVVEEALKVPARVWREAWKALMDTDHSEELGKIKAPTLIVWGDQDELIPRSEQDALAAEIAGSRLMVYPGIGHGLHWENPERFTADLVAFTESITGRGRDVRKKTITKFEERNAMITQDINQERAGTLAGRDAPNGAPHHLPYSVYPKAKDVARHGLQPLPESLPLVDFAGAEPYRSVRYSTVGATELTKDQLLQTAWAIGDSFARREPQARYLQPPKSPPAGLMEASHTDPFGTDSFGSWDSATHLYWVIRLSALTDPTAPQGAIEVNEEVLAGSVAIVDEEGRIIGGAFNETMGPFDVMPEFREGDPFLDTVMGIWEPVYAALGAQDAEALTALSERYPAFREAYEKGKVGHHLLVARSDDLPKEDAFELVAASAERYRTLGYEYIVTEATNQWTGAAFEALGGVRVHFASFQAQPAVHKSDEPVEDVISSPNGFLSDKDSGGMFYVLRLA